MLAEPAADHFPANNASLPVTVYLLATLDTKGTEAAFVAARLRELGVAVTLVDTGCRGEPAVQADVTRAELFAAAGTTHAQLLAGGDRGAAVSQAALGAAQIVERAYACGQLTGVLSLGGSAGTTIGTAAMRRLPIGVPKLMVSTLAASDVSAYVGDKDILMLNSVVDLLGINRISRLVLGAAAAAMAGLVLHRLPASDTEKPLVCATMFGVTTPCVERAREVLAEAGYEVLVFHATGAGGRAMESLIADGLVAGLLDITTTELADELVGGILSAGPDRLTAAARRGVPQVVSVGACDMVNFGARESVPGPFRNRKLHVHNAAVTLMRTTPAECAALGALLGKKVAASTGPAAIMLPQRGVSAIDAAGEPFDDPQARKELFAAIKENAGDVPVVELDRHINDPEFAEAAARRLLQMLQPASQADGSADSA